MKRKKSMKPTSGGMGLASMMNQGTGPKPVKVPVGDLESLMGQGSSPHCKPVEGRDKLRKLMNQ